MSDRLKELREKRAKIVADLRIITETAEKEKRDLTADEAAKHEALFKEQDKVRASITAEERSAELIREEAERKLKDDEEKKRRAKDLGVSDEEPLSPRRQLLRRDDYRGIFRRFLRNGLRADDQRLIDEIRGLSQDADPSGGYLIAPEQFVTQLIKFADDMVFMRPLATRFTVENAKSLGAPSLDNDPADADWTAEIATGSEDTTMSFGKRELQPWPLAKRIKVSKKLLRNSAMDPADIVLRRMAYKFAITEEKAFLTGSGANQPLGVFTASNDGIPTSRDVQTGSATDFTFDGLIDAKYSLKSNYLGAARWLFHRTGVQKIAKLKDSQNRYLWEPSLQAGQPDRLLNLPLLMSEYVPNTFTTGLYVGMLADFSWYWIADALDITIQRLVELYAETNQDGFIARKETDGMPVLAEAFVRLKTN